MKNPPSLAKLTAPDPARVYPRLRLFKRLDEACKGRVIWITAPAGSGKTTLVTSYLRDRKLRAVWYHLDAGDGDVASFFSYLGLAAKMAASHSTAALPLFTAEYVTGLPAFARNYFRLLYSHIYPIQALVFDDYHEVPLDSPFHMALREGLAEVPEGFSVILISRNDPPPELARLRTLDTFTLLDWNELRLAPEESLGVGVVRLGENLPSEALLRMLHERTQGWVAGLILMLEQGIDADWSNDPIQAASNPVVFDYFAGEVFARTDARVQEFLVKTALLPRLTAETAAALTGIADAGELLADLFRRNYFTVRHARTGHAYAYEYHPLFRRFLLDQGWRRLTPNALAEAKRRAAQLLADSGEPEACAILLREIGDWEHLAELVLRHAPMLLREGRYQTLHDWLAGLPVTVRATAPWLNYFFGICRLPFDPAEARAWLEQAYKDFSTADIADGQFLAWAGIIDTYLYAWSDFHPADRWIDEFGRLRARYPDFPSREVEVRAVAAIFAILMYRQPQHEELPFWAARVEALLFQDIDPALRMTAASHLVLYYNWWVGRLAKVKELVGRLEPFADMREIGPFIRIVWEGILTTSYWMTAKTEESLAAAQRGLALAEQSGVHLWDFMLLGQCAMAAAAAGDLEKMRALLQRMRGWPINERRLDGFHYYYLCFMEAAARRDADAMLEHAMAGMQCVEIAGVMWGEGYARTALARALFATGDAEGALRELDRARRIANEMGCTNALYSVFEIETEFAQARGDKQALLDSLGALFALMREQGFVNSAWWRAAEMVRLCRIALEHDIETEFVRYLIRLRSLKPDEPAALLERWPWPIKIYTLGRFEILKDEVPIRFSGKVQKKPMELLKALIAFGGQRVTEERLAEALWPDAEGDAAHNAFVTTLQRLRKLLDNKQALIYREGHLSLDTQQCWVDAWAFELWQDSHAKTPDPTGLQKALALYRGAFLVQDADAYWAISMRERIRRRFIRSTRELGQYWESRGQWEQAAECHERGLAVDDTAEEFYQQLMICYSQLGRGAEVHAVYQRCREVLAATLQTSPSKRTEALLRELQRP